MKPVAIFRHVPFEGPGYLAQFLDRHAVPWRLVAMDAGDPVPPDVRDFSGLVLMGGPMSANDDLPWIEPTLALIRAAVEHDIPVLGHCLGGQLMSKALGAAVTRNPVKEIGWGEVTVSDNAGARAWFGDIFRFEAFHWHGETFSLPRGAAHLLASAHCTHQAWAMGKHLALQCHVEMTGQMVRDWCESGAQEIESARNRVAVQTAKTMQAQMHAKLPPLQRVAERLYQHWLRGLSRKNS
ncbi:type 1 glutamine amidotransferase [Ferrigenium sp. UT5]|uniref:type 1 glutamine amidotransferase n=1 Tax=Ferrigenium sp. UT5 TaxID=3242105 RepID=UPI0035526E3C